MIGLSWSTLGEHAKLNRDKLLYAAMYSVILEVRNWLLNGQELRNKKRSRLNTDTASLKYYLIYDLERSVQTNGDW